MARNAANAMSTSGRRDRHVEIRLRIISRPAGDYGVPPTLRPPVFQETWRRYDLCIGLGESPTPRGSGSVDLQSNRQPKIATRPRQPKTQAPTPAPDCPSGGKTSKSVLVRSPG